ncbi:MAG: hypothetical protein EP321_02320 [Sphingomonadales bacterium]|nr:MAG: hypothetical protein EP345_16285 [Sphingomonadales bacterium]TNF05744.1 MAG: hypothetical protein EP321_02320 [Sphingomonadales bacterium]
MDEPPLSGPPRKMAAKQPSEDGRLCDWRRRTCGGVALSSPAMPVLTGGQGRIVKRAGGHVVRFDG